MTKTYTLRERTTGPANVKAVAVPRTHKGASGSLSVGATYYYKAIANGYSDYYDDLNAWLSVPSDETSAVTTDASNRVIWIHTDNNVAGQEETTIIRTETSGDYRQMINGTIQRHFPRVDNCRSNHYSGVKTDKTEFNRYEMTTSAMTLTEGEVITGVTSGATAYVVSNPAGGTTFKVWTVVGTFEAGETLNGSVSGAGIGTFTSLSVKDGWVFEDFSSSSARIFPIFDDGLPCLQAESDKTNDPVTPQDVYEWFIDNGTPQYYGLLIMEHHNIAMVFLCFQIMIIHFHQVKIYVIFLDGNLVFIQKISKYPAELLYHKHSLNTCLEMVNLQWEKLITEE